MIKVKVLLAAILLTGTFASRGHDVQAQSSRTAQEQAQRLDSKAIDYFYEGNFSQAKQQLMTSLRIAEDVFETHFWLGRIYALHAGSSPQDKANAVHELRRALQIQPHGENGDIARAWLLTVGGRPQTIRFVTAQSQGQNMDWSATKSTMQALPALARSDNFDVLDVSRQAMPLNQMSKSDLLNLCKDDSGTITAGWLVGVSVGRFNVQWSADRNGKHGGYTASGDAKVWLFDPLAQEMFPEIPVSNSSFNVVGALLGLHEQNSNDAYKTGLSNLSQSIWDSVTHIAKALPDPKLLDKTSLPLNLDWVYAQASAPYAQAVHLPLVIFPSCMKDGEDDANAAKQMQDMLEDALMRGGKMAILTPGSTGAALSAMGYNSKSHNAQQLGAVASRLGSRYIVFSKVTDLKADVSNWVIFTKVKARATLVVIVLDSSTGKYVLQKAYHEKSSATKLLAGKAVTTFLKEREKVLRQAGDDAAKDLLPLLEKGA